MAVDLITFILGNFPIIISMAISIIILLISFYFNNKTHNIGFVLLLIAQLILIGWDIINLIVFQGVFLTQELNNQGYSISEIVNITNIVSIINISLFVISSFLLIFAIIIIGNSIKKEISSTNSYNF